MTVRRLIALAASLVVLALPSAALAQGAGDDQYSDPFGSGQSGDSGSSGGGGDSSGSSPTPAPAPAPGTGSSTSTSTSTSSAPAATTAAATATAAPGTEAAAPVTTSQGQLPYTGADAGLLALAGVLCVGGGVALRVRLREQR
jgi:LPXTG-motif cell wall-anchored protein